MDLLPSQNTNGIETYKDAERFYFQRLMHVAQGNIYKAVRLSGLSRATIYRKIAEYKIQRFN